MASTRGRAVVVPLTNKSGGSVAAGDVVVIDTSNNEAFTTSTAGAVTGGVGIAQETIASNATGRVLVHGYAALVNVNASVTRGNYGKTYTVAKQATDAGSSRVAGAFCQFLTGGTTPSARVFSPDLGAAAGNVAADAIWDAAGDLAVGTGADTAAKVSLGATGKVLTSNGSTAIWAYPPGYELDYVAQTSSTNVTATTEAGADTIITGTSQAYAAGTVMVEAFIPQTRTGTGGAGSTINFVLFDGSTNLGQWSEERTVASSALGVPTFLRRKVTLTAATHQMILKAFVSSGTGIAGAGAGGAGTIPPAYIRVTVI